MAEFPVDAYFLPAGISVPRSRFLSVKTTSDLLLVMSDLFTVEHGMLKMNPKRSYPALPLVKLGDLNFGNVGDRQTL